MDAFFTRRLLPFLIITHLILAAVLIAGINSSISAEHRHWGESQLQRELGNNAALFARLDEGARDKLYADPGLADREKLTGVQFYRLNELQLQSDSPDLPPEMTRALIDGLGFHERSINGSPVLDGALKVAENQGGFIVQMSLPGPDFHRGLAFSDGYIALILFFQFLLMSIVGLIVINQFGSSLRAIDIAIEHYRNGEHQHRIPIGMPGRLAVGSTGIPSRIAAGLQELQRQNYADIASLKNLREELESILANMREGIVLLTGEEKLLLINESALGMFDQTGDPLIYRGKQLADVFRNSELNRAAEHLIQNGGEHRDSLQVWNRSAEGYRSLDLRGIRLEAAGDSGDRILFVLHDITELQRLETIRRDFVSNVSHELKTPITTIQGFAETLSEGAFEEKDQAERFSNIILRQARRMGQILSDLLTLSRIEQQETAIAFSRANLNEIAGEVQEVCRASAEKRTIKLHYSLAGRESAVINTSLFEQALVNLVDNAVKYGREGGDVWMSMENGKSELQVIIQDNGTGIAMRDIPRLWERFYRVDKARSSSLGSTGLGLAIVKHIARVHGGTVSVKSTVGEGSSFIISIPQPPTGSDQEITRKNS